jgi:hypothetical protein
MVSKTLASLDAWLALAEEVLAEQDALQQEHRPRKERTEPDGPAAPELLPSTQHS